jgi:hypothetical protein
MPSARQLSDATPAIALAVLFSVFAVVGSELDDGATLPVWRIVAACVAIACLWGARHRESEKVRIVAGAVSTSWIVLWALFVLWRKPESVDATFMSFMFVLAVFATWYWSRAPLPVVFHDSETHGARASGSVRILPAVMHSEVLRWSDMVKSSSDATDRELVAESE